MSESKSTKPVADADVRSGPLNDNGDPKDNPVLPNDESAIADPNDPTKIIDAGSDPDFAA